MRSLRASVASPQSDSPRCRRRPTDLRSTSLPSTSRDNSWDTRIFETPSRPSNSAAVIQGQSASRSNTRFSPGFSMAGSRWSGPHSPLSGNSIRSGYMVSTSGGSESVPPRQTPRFSTSDSPNHVPPDGVRQMSSCGSARAASSSSATKASPPNWDISRRVCRTRTASGASTSTVQGPPSSPSRQARLENPVRSAVAPWRTIPRVRSPGRRSAASSARLRYHSMPANPPAAMARLAATR